MMYQRNSQNATVASDIDKFVTDIKDYTASVSGCTTPVGIIMFAVWISSLTDIG